MSKPGQVLRAAAAQIAPVYLQRAATVEKALSWCARAADQGAQLLAFPEALVPGYPTWLARTHGAAFEDPLQKEIHARYLDQAVELPGAELTALQQAAGDHRMHLVLGVVERVRGTLYCTALSVRPDGEWTAHRKLMPTYEERLCWGVGDGHGLRVHDVGGFKVGALNCWENWMPAARLALYAQGLEVHVSLWPGSPQNTTDISRFTAREGRVFVVAASAVLAAEDLPADMPAREQLVDSAQHGFLHTGGSRILGPDGNEIATADQPEEQLLVADLDRGLLLRERQNFDPAGHYHRSDIFEFKVDRRRPGPAEFLD